MYLHEPRPETNLPILAFKMWEHRKRATDYFLPPTRTVAFECDFQYLVGIVLFFFFLLLRRLGALMDYESRLGLSNEPRNGQNGAMRLGSYRDVRDCEI
jgi:hypothetical protein